MMAVGVGLSHCGDFQAKGAANRGKPLSAAAVGCAAAVASAASLERRRSALAPRPERIYYCATGVEMPLYEPCNDRKDQRDI